MRNVSNPPPHIYTNLDFDRASPRRRDRAWLEAAAEDPTARLLLLCGLKVAVVDDDAGPRLFLPRRIDLPGPVEGDLFLGSDREGAVFARQCPDETHARARFVELRSVGVLLAAPEAGLAAYARALAHWAERHRFCGVCGGPTDAVEAGHIRRCRECAVDVFPRTDPAVIVLVTREDRCVLGRARRFPAGMYSTLAGFVEPGESLESALAREIYEEVGLEIEGATYRSSQPWPFPQSLMLGFRARARTEVLNIELDELEDARWFSRSELRDEGSRPVQLPNPDSIARYLIDEWLAETEG
jgi:NAD+ diphosphatase